MNKIYLVLNIIKSFFLNETCKNRFAVLKWQLLIRKILNFNQNLFTALIFNQSILFNKNIRFV